jgi:ParB family chromosome partitioning protein
MMQGKIDMGHGRALLSLSPVQQIKIANVIVQKQLSVRETEKLVSQIEHPAPKKMKKPDRDLLRLQEDVSERLGAQVAIKPKKNGQGNIVIHYTSLDQLDDILSKL